VRENSAKNASMIAFMRWKRNRKRFHVVGVMLMTKRIVWMSNGCAEP
jgi:hypothetical protein